MALKIKKNKNKTLLTLAPVMDASMASLLRDELMVAAAREKPLALQADEVSQLHILCVQTLLVAARHWQKQGWDFGVQQPSGAFKQAFTDLGLPHLKEAKDVA